MWNFGLLWPQQPWKGPSQFFSDSIKSKDLLWQSKSSMILLRWPHLNLKASEDRGGAAKVLCKLPTDPKPQMMVNTLSFMRVTYIPYTLSFLKVFSFLIVNRMSCPKLRRSMLEIVFRGKNQFNAVTGNTWKSWERPCMQLIMWHPLIMYQENGKFTFLYDESVIF